MYFLRKLGSHCYVCLGVFKTILQTLPLAVYFCCVFGGFGTFLAIWRFWRQIWKKPASVTKKDISDHIYQIIYISLWFYGWGFGCKNSSKIITFRPKMRSQWHNANLLDLFNPENGQPWHRPTTYLKANNGNKFHVTSDQFKNWKPLKNLLGGGTAYLSTMTSYLIKSCNVLVMTKTKGWNTWWNSKNMYVMSCLLLSSIFASIALWSKSSEGPNQTV